MVSFGLSVHVHVISISWSTYYEKLLQFSGTDCPYVPSTSILCICQVKDLLDRMALFGVAVAHLRCYLLTPTKMPQASVNTRDIAAAQSSRPKVLRMKRRV